MHHRPPPPPSFTARLRRRTAPVPGSVQRPGRLWWAPLLLALVVGAIALTGALGGGVLPGLTDAATSTGAQQRSDPAGAAATSSASGATSPAPLTVAAPTVETPVPSPTPSPTPTPTPTPGPTSSAPAPEPTPEPTPEETVAGTVASAPPPAVGSGPEGEVLALVNEERSAAGCAPLRADEGLAAVARAHSADMRDRGYFSHVDPAGQDPFDRAAAAGVDYARAENIAYGQPDAAAVMAAWMDSSGHRRNVLDCSLGSLGVGIAEGAGGPWWTQLFGS